MEREGGGGFSWKEVITELKQVMKLISLISDIPTQAFFSHA